MIKVEAVTLEEAYVKAASKLKCSITNLNIEVVQAPTNGFLGLFKKNAIIVATKKIDPETPCEPTQSKKINKPKEPEIETSASFTEKKQPQKKKQPQEIFNNTIMPQSFVSIQDDRCDGFEHIEDIEDDIDMDEESYEESIQESTIDIKEIAIEVKKDINNLFNKICFDIDEVDVSQYDDSTLLIEFSGADAALLIGKEGYRYKALSYMLFNWINTKYKIGLRLEIAEFLKNQEESVIRYLENVYANINRDGRAQTKILDGVLVQIALKELRNTYPDKYVAIRTTRDGLKYIIINEYHSNK
ncbi:MAG: Jag N-terminal domain-containing protein [Sulfurimonas sp.]|nr:Jag N-terminal domain-containing protein [Sulfurimonas sp.]